MAAYISKEGRPGPVWLDIPLDVQASYLETDMLQGYVPEKKEKSFFDLDVKLAEVVTMLKNAKRPIIIAGQGIERGNGRNMFRNLADALAIPVLTSWIAVELLPYEHPSNLGKPGMVAARYSNFTMQNADLVIAIGTRLDPAMIGYTPGDFAPNAKKIIVDIDISELNKFEFPVDVKIQADAAFFIEKFLEQIKKDAFPIQFRDWLNICQAWKREYPVLLPEYEEEKEAVNPYWFIDTLFRVSAADDVLIPGSSGAGIDVFWLCAKNKPGQRMLATGSLGSMGYGLPAAIGACLASGKRTICVEGDGSIGLNIQELASVRGMNLPIKFFIMDNGGYLSIMNMQRAHFKGHYVGSNEGSRLFLPDIKKVAAGYGIPVFEIQTHDNMEERIQQILEIDGPALCRVCMKDNIVIQPKVVSRVNEDGSMNSGKLIDLWPFLPEDEMKRHILKD